MSDYNRDQLFAIIKLAEEEFAFATSNLMISKDEANAVFDAARAHAMTLPKMPKKIPVWDVEAVWHSPDAAKSIQPTIWRYDTKSAAESLIKTLEANLDDGTWSHIKIVERVAEMPNE